MICRKRPTGRYQKGMVLIMESWQQNEAFRSMDPQKQSMIEQLAASLHGKKAYRSPPTADPVEKNHAAGEYSVYPGRKSDLNGNFFGTADTTAEKTI